MGESDLQCLQGKKWRLRLIRNGDLVTYWQEDSCTVIWTNNQSILPPTPIPCSFQGTNSCIKKKTNSETGHLPLRLYIMWPFNALTAHWSTHHLSHIFLIHPGSLAFQHPGSFLTSSSKGFLELPVVIIASHTVFPQSYEQLQSWLFLGTSAQPHIPWLSLRNVWWRFWYHLLAPSGLAMLPRHLYFIFP